MSCSMTQHRAPGEDRTHNFAIKSEALPTELSVLPLMHTSKGSRECTLLKNPEYTGIITYEPRHEKTGLRGFTTRSDTNQVRQSQNMARALKFRIKKEEGLFYLCSENKDADQLRSNCIADQRLCFRICKNRFITTLLIYTCIHVCIFGACKLNFR